MAPAKPKPPRKSASSANRDDMFSSSIGIDAKAKLGACVRRLTVLNGGVPVTQSELLRHLIDAEHSRLGKPK